MALDRSVLEGFCGTSEYHPHWTGVAVMTDGVKYLADEGGAHWLVDAIISHQSDDPILSSEMLRYMQFWKFVVADGVGTLTCVEDTGRRPAVTQKVPFTDFPLREVEVWVERGMIPVGKGLREMMVVMLPQER